MNQYTFMKKSSLVLLFMVLCTLAYAQIPAPPNCSPLLNDSVKIVGSNSNSCGVGVTLSANVFFKEFSTDTYSVSQVPYAPYPSVLANTAMSQGSPLADDDDIWGDQLILPFQFCYFGVPYTTLLIGSNGNITFNIPTNAPGGGNQYSFTNGAATNISPIMPLNNPTLNNTISGPNSDIHPQPNTGCSITWQVFGTAPCRVFVASWDSVPYYNAATICSLARTSQQIAIYESTNIIDCTIKYKQLCSSNTSNAASAIQGIQNATGTKAFVVPGRNGGQWTDSQSTWRFAPAGISYSWKNLSTGVVIATTSTIAVNPLATTQYELTVVAGCANPITLKDTFQVNVSNPLIPDFTYQVSLGCEDDTIQFTNASVGANNYLWRFGDGQGSILTNPKHIYVNQAVYTITLIGIDGTCRDSVKKIIDLRHPINASLVTIADSFCLSNPVAGVNVLISNTSTGGGLVSTFNLSDASGTLQTVTRNNLNPVNFNIKTAGVYTISLNVVDTLGCVDSFRKVIFIDNTPYADFTISDSIICVGEPTQFRDTVPEFSKLFTWNFGDGLLETNKHNPFHNYDADGIKIVTLTATFPVCPPYVVTKTVLVNDYPSVQLGPDTSYCPELTAAINLNPNSFGTSYLWSNGKTTPSIVVSEAGKYWVEVSNNGCAAVDTIEVQRDCYINIPNSFTPNGDGLNNYFMPADLWRGISQYQMDIFNRWGEQVFTTTNINSRGWDGKFGGKDQPVGTYIYQINVLFKTGQRKTYTGNVTLLR
jgi:gliding motility-associated-like protein